MSTRDIPLSDALVEVSSGVGAAWSNYRVLGATRSGLALAKEPVGKSPERYKLVEPGTIFYNPMRIMIGSIAMVDDGEEPGITSPDYVVFRTRPGVLHHRWFYYWLRSKYGEDLIRSLARGAVRERLLFRRLARGLIIAPSWERQCAAARVLSRVPVMQRAVTVALAATDRLMSASLWQWFNGARAQRWPERKLGHLLELRNEVVHPRDNPSGARVFVGLEHIASHAGIRTGSLDVEMSELTGRKPRFCKGDIVYGYLRPYLNKVWVAEFDGLCSVDQYVYKVNRDLADVDFLAWFMRSPTYLKRAPIDTTPGQLPRIRLGEIANVPVNLPPLTEQERISGLLNMELQRASRIQNALTEQRATIGALATALLHSDWTTGQ